MGRYTARSDAIPSAPTVAENAATNSTSISQSPVQNVSASTTEPDFKTVDEAWATLNRAGEEYQRASAYLSASNTDVPMPPNPSQYRTRLAALDGVMSEIRGAMKEAPQDPVINQYYLTTVSAREATLRQLGTTLRPAGVSLSRF